MTVRWDTFFATCLNEQSVQQDDDFLKNCGASFEWVGVKHFFLTHTFGIASPHELLSAVGDTQETKKTFQKSSPCFNHDLDGWGTKLF